MPETSQQPLPTGTRIRSFEIREVLGCGGFGITYKAWDHQLECDVAIKEYLPVELARRDADGVTVTALPEQPEQEETYTAGLEKFLNEARTLAKFHSPYLVGVKQFISDHGTAYMVMDYERGRSLAEAVRVDGPLPEEKLRRLVTCLLEGLAALHEHGILHRDIKPANVYLRENGEPVLLDFGSARPAGRGPRGNTEMTSMVSLGYAPHEQYSRRGNQGPWTDLYALGATLYFCATGKKPVDGMDRFLARKDGWPDPLSPLAEQAGDRYDARLLGVIDWMMRVEIGERPRGTRQVLDVLSGATPLPTAGVDPEATQPGEAAARLGDTVLVEGGDGPPPAPPGGGRWSGWRDLARRLPAGRRGLAALGLVGLALALALAHWGLQARLAAATEARLAALVGAAAGLTLSADEVDAPLFGRQVVLRGLRVTNPEGYQAHYFFAVAQARIRFRERRWWAGDPIEVEAVELSAPQISYERHPDTRRSNLLEIRRRLPKPAGLAPWRALRPGRLDVRGGEIQAVSFPRRDEIVTKSLPALEVAPEGWRAREATAWVREIIARINGHALKAARASRIIRRATTRPAPATAGQPAADPGRQDKKAASDLARKLKEIFSKPPSDVFPQGEEEDF